MAPGPEKQFDPEKAVEKAVEVFQARGFEGASLSELLSRMEIGRKSLYDTFGCKRELFQRALDHYSRIQTDELRRTLEQPGSPMRHLREVMRKLQRRHSERGSTGCLLGTSIADFDTSDAEMARRLRDHLRGIEEVFRETLERARDAGELDEDVSPRDAARMLLCLSQGMALVGRVLDDGAIPRSAVSAATALLDRT